MKALLVLALLPVGAWLLLRAFERSMLFHPSRELTAHPGTVGLRWEPVSLAAADGTPLRAWWIPGPSPDSPAMLCLHGNAGNLSSRTDKMRMFHDAGAAQLWVEWRGYGESAGRPSEKGLLKDAEAGLVWLLMRVPAAKTILYGESLGAAYAAELAARGGVGGLILDSAFSSVRDMAAAVFPRLPSFLVSSRLDVAARLPAVAMPVLVLHSAEDEIVPVAQARKNYDAVAAPKRFVELKGSHNDAFLESGRAYTAAIREFLAAPPAPPEPAKKP